MNDGSADPYLTLSVTPGASDAELRAAYRRLAQLHHPDHNGGSSESARRFEAVQRAYAQIRALRASAGGPGRPMSGANPDPDSRLPHSDLESRLAGLEHELQAARAARELQAARAARERAQRMAREAASAQDQPTSQRPSDEELGYITTEDSFSKILADAASELSEHLRHE